MAVHEEYGNRQLTIVLAIITTMVVSAPGVAQSDEGSGWFFTTEFTAVWTGGNAESNTLGMDASLRRAWSNAELKIVGGSVRSQ